jgi:signal transduction histidine kinase
MTVTAKPTDTSQQTTEELRSDGYLFPAPMSPGSVWGEDEHLVQFYETDAFLVELLSDFIEKGLFAGDICLMFATSAHLERLEEQLQTRHLDLTSPRVRGAYHTFDADEILAQVVVDGMPERERVREVVGSLLIQTAQQGCRIRVFGEMVVQLWTQGNPAAAIRLEELWNELRQTVTAFSLLCAYPMHIFAGQEHQEPFTTICQQHAHVRPDESYPALSDPEERLRAITLLQQKAASLETEIEKYKELERQKDALISMVTHELKTPLTALQGNLQLVQRRLRRVESLLSPEQRESQELVEGALSLLSRGQQLLRVQNRLINDLLDVARLQQHTLELQLAPCDLIALVDDLVQDYQVAYPQRLITLNLPEQEHFLALIDRDRIGQVIGNYLTNALKYSPLDKAIHIGLEVSSAAAHLWVQDYGPGISPKAQQRIWEQFYQVPGILAQNGGGPSLGLGLYICQQLIERHHGQVGVESIPGQGARFWFRLPPHLSDT